MNFREKIAETVKERNSRIVLALDLPPEKPYKALLSKALQILDETQEYICAVKINRQLILPLGLFGETQKIISAAKDYKLPLIMDCKINDVGHTNQIIAKYYFEAGFDAVTANPFVGWEEGLKPVFEIAHKNGKGVILLV
ncbi:orotidine 5'-phosphate decarboxylase, partial [Candidatus Bathyarchaeota archaeon]